MDILIIYILIINYIFCLSSENTIYSLFWLIFFFFNCFLLLFIFDIKIISVLILIIYVGAIAVLFLFLIMILNFSKKIKNFNIITLKKSINKGIWVIFMILLIFLIITLSMGSSPVYADGTCTTCEACDISSFLSLLEDLDKDYETYQRCLKMELQMKKLMSQAINSGSCDDINHIEFLKLLSIFSHQCCDILKKYKSIKK